VWASALAIMAIFYTRKINLWAMVWFQRDRGNLQAFRMRAPWRPGAPR
jgi:hypothetical protein